jgi:hypothetical protein
MKLTELASITVEYVETLYRWFIKRKIAITIFVIIALALPAYALLINVFLPLKTAGLLVPYENYQQPSIDTIELKEKPGEETLQKIQEIERLEIKKAYLGNRLKLARSTDSVYMSINLIDSTIHLEIKGVEVRVCPITQIKTSRSLLKASHNDLFAWLSGPFELEEGFATIPKIPYVIKEAPKDTLEAQAQSAMPLPVDTASVFFTLYFDRGLVLEIEQAEEPYTADKRVLRKYNHAKNKFSRKNAFNAVFRGKTAQPVIHIRLMVSKEDARAIYRGIPDHAMLALNL